MARPRVARRAGSWTDAARAAALLGLLRPRAPRRCALSRLPRRLHRLVAEPVWLRGVRVWAPVAYSGPARDLVRALKFRLPWAWPTRWRRRSRRTPHPGSLPGVTACTRPVTTRAAHVRAATTRRPPVAEALGTEDRPGGRGLPWSGRGRPRPRSAATERERRAGPAGSDRARAGPRLRAFCSSTTSSPPGPRSPRARDVLRRGPVRSEIAAVVFFARTLSGTPDVSSSTPKSQESRCASS